MNSKGFTLLETIAAIAILMSGVLVVYASSARMLAYTYDNQYQLVASYLAQEGIETVRNIRDQNWIDGAEGWRDGLDAGDWRIQYDSTALIADNDTPLLLAENDFYGYDSGEATVFKRKITISHLSDDSLKVIAEVSWPYGQKRSIQAEKILYNWF